jgi:hypothetical protein
VPVSLPAFLVYCLLLVLSGAILLASAIGGFGQRPFARIAEALFGGGFVAYGVYLLFFFGGGEFTMFYYAFVAPVFAIVHVVRSRRRAAPPPPARPGPLGAPQPPRIREFGMGAPTLPVPAQLDGAYRPPGMRPPLQMQPVVMPTTQVSRTGPSTSL